MMIFSYFFSSHSSIVPVSNENYCHGEIGVTRTCYTRCTFVSHALHIRVTLVTRTCDGNYDEAISCHFF